MQNKIIQILGQKGTGKSTQADIITKDIDRLVMFDPLDDFGGGLIIRSISTFEEYLPLLANPLMHFRAVLKFYNDDHYQEVFELLYPHDAPPALRNYTLFVDEIHLFASSHTMVPALKRIVTTGRHADIDMIFVSQRPLNIHPTVRSQTSEVISGRQTNEADIKQIERDYNFPVEKLRNLKDWEFIRHKVL